MAVSALGFLSMQHTINNDLVAHNFKKRPVIARPHSVFGEVIAVGFFIEVVFEGR
jgi:hypothetical protein